MSEQNSPFRPVGAPIMVDAGPVQFVSNSSVPMTAARTDMSDLVSNPTAAEIVIGNCTMTIPFAFQFHEGDVGHTMLFGQNGKGMSALVDALQRQHQERGGKPVLFDKDFTLDQLIDPNEEAQPS